MNMLYKFQKWNHLSLGILEGFPEEGDFKGGQSIVVSRLVQKGGGEGIVNGVDLFLL